MLLSAGTVTFIAMRLPTTLGDKSAGASRRDLGPLPLSPTSGAIADMPASTLGPQPVAKCPGVTARFLSRATNASHVARGDVAMGTKEGKDTMNRRPKTGALAMAGFANVLGS